MQNMETEIKYQIKDPRILRDSLRAIGAKFIGREIEKDTWLTQKSVGCGINPVRVRILKNGGLLTQKGDCLKSKYKKRQEFQVKVNDPKILLQIFNKMGFSETRHIEKVRETYHYHGASILLDRLPFMGYFVEIEGTPKKIDRITKSLGFNQKDGMKESYSDFFNTYKIIKAVKDARYKDITLTFHSERSFR